MVRASLFAAALVSMLATLSGAQTGDFKPVTREMLANPAPGDWLMLNRTYDEQRFSPLKEINRDTVAGLTLAWARGMAAGTNESIPIVYQGVMYVVSPGAGLVALDARTGKVRWETKVQDYKELTQHTSAPLVVEGKVITGRTCETRAGCFIAAHDARTGKEVWKFYNTAAPGEPGGDTWGNVPAERRVASSWGLPGSYDPERKTLYWAVANPKPYTRLKRHGSADGTAQAAPADLYSNSTLALDIETGKLKWYYQHMT